MSLIVRQRSPRLDIPAISQESILCLDLPDQYFRGPPTARKPYASIAILDPVVTIERHGGNYHIAARFNIETTILGYNEREKDGHEMYFHDICLQYCNRLGHENLVMKPESDPATAFTVTRSTNIEISGTAGLSGSQVPSASVSLGLTRSHGLEVEYAVSSWSVSSHRVVRGGTSWPENGAKMKESVWNKGRSSSGDSAGAEERHVAQYQWYWAGTQEETKKLTPDLKHTVKRYVVAKRVIPEKDFPCQRVRSAREQALTESVVKNSKDSQKSQSEMVPVFIAANRARHIAETIRLDDLKQPPSLEDLLDFHFTIQVRVKRRHGRTHRLLLLTSNQLKSKFMEPKLVVSFCFRPSFSVVDIPLQDTESIDNIIEKIKNANDGNWDPLKTKNIMDMEEYNTYFAAENLWSTQLGIAQVDEVRETEGHRHEGWREENAERAREQMREMHRDLYAEGFWTDFHVERYR
ncbi:hypothetical protein DL98DRAFT_508886 [Cadophora sp. DSE1049]|nr:hypothetical protein DL98DRAFT_508886 [Cadophora sp. DSE1049]